MPVVESGALGEFIVRMFQAVGTPEHDAREWPRT